MRGLNCQLKGIKLIADQYSIYQITKAQLFLFSSTTYFPNDTKGEKNVTDSLKL